MLSGLRVQPGLSGLFGSFGLFRLFGYLVEEKRGFK